MVSAKNPKQDFSQKNPKECNCLKQFYPDLTQSRKIGTCHASISNKTHFEPI